MPRRIDRYSLVAALLACVTCRTLAADDSLAPPPAGVGLALRIDEGRVLVGKILPDSPAERSGLIAAGDRILAIGQGNDEAKNVTGCKMEEVTGMIRGTSGSVVRLTVVAADKPESDARVISLTRGNVKGLGTFGVGKLLAAGTVAPDFGVTRLADGEKRKLSDYAGRIVVVEFWACWCKPCLEQLDRLPSIVEKHPEWADTVVILAVSIDDEQGDPAALVKRRGWKGIEAVWSGPAPLQPYHAPALPTRYVIDRDGKVADADQTSDLATVLDTLLDPRK